MLDRGSFPGWSRRRHPSSIPIAHPHCPGVSGKALNHLLDAVPVHFRMFLHFRGKALQGYVREPFLRLAAGEVEQT